MPKTPSARAKGFRKVIDESGQLYTETESTPVASLLNGPTWVHESPYMPIGWDDRSPFEAPPLRQLAMRKLLSDQRNLSLSLFENVPWPIASDMWDFLGRCKKQSLHMWKLLATLHPAQFREVEQYRSMKIEGPKLSMREYLGLTKSENMSWRVVLTLAESYARVPELVGISEIRNLVALDISTPAKTATLPETDIQMTALTDRIVRAWSELAQTAGAFTQLRVLILRYQMDLSKVALHYLRDLPNLQLVVAFGCPGIASALSKNDIDGWTIAEVKRSPPETLHEIYEAGCTASDDEDSTFGKPPILDFQIGKMMPKVQGRVNSPHSHSAIYLQPRDNAPRRVDPEPNTRKRKEVGYIGDQREQPPLRKGKAIMKDRTKDIGDVLGDFF